MAAWANSAEVQKLARALAAADAKLRQAQSNGGAGAPVEDEATTDEKAKQRLRQLGGLLKTANSRGDPRRRQAKEAKSAVQAELRSKIAAARPLGQRLRYVVAQINNQDRKLSGIRGRLAQLLEQEAAAGHKLAELDKQMEELQMQQRALQREVPTPPGAPTEPGARPLDEPIKRLNVTLKGLGEVMGALGAGHAFSERPQTSLGQLRRAGARAREQQRLDRERAGEARRGREAGAAEPQDIDVGDDMAEATGETAVVEEMAEAGGDKRNIDFVPAKHGAKYKRQKAHA
ncbi:unnamed protein product [Prorocentrum cordatum]|uniref:Pinin/SDK/MemA protein domain-containing protein n=1 Tax=Prorocentrum cordatum TaxID=2364126 RepID=A0ABN9V284_9DINO|nr:unnamed protein product [Polarella glacialis]